MQASWLTLIPDKITDAIRAVETNLFIVDLAKLKNNASYSYIFQIRRAALFVANINEC